jgi:molybdate transport system substrate-binding protein
MFESENEFRIQLTLAPVAGESADALVNRVNRGDTPDVLMMPTAALDNLVKSAKISLSLRFDVLRSSIGLSVRAGYPKPDIATLDALRSTLQSAKSIAYSSAGSGIYLEKELFPELGLAQELTHKSKIITGEMVGAAVARGEADLAFQQISELLPIPGLDYVGPLPVGAQRSTVVAAGVNANTAQREAAEAWLNFLRGEHAAATLLEGGLEPVRS